MPRRMSATSRAVLVQLEERPKTIDELAEHTGLDKVRLAYMLRDLQRLGWVTVAASIRKSRWRVHVYGLARRVPAAAQVSQKAVTLTPNVAALYGAFRMGLPRTPPKGRRIRGAR
jgi:DNA-binding IclR family transcriptional regulator